MIRTAVEDDVDALVQLIRIWPSTSDRLTRRRSKRISCAPPCSARPQPSSPWSPRRRAPSSVWPSGSSASLRGQDAPASRSRTSTCVPAIVPVGRSGPGHPARRHRPPGRLRADRLVGAQMERARPALLSVARARNPWTSGSATGCPAISWKCWPPMSPPKVGHRGHRGIMTPAGAP